MLVDELRMSVAAEQHAEVVEPSDDALQLDAIDEEDRQGGFLLADVVEERVLEALGFFGSHVLLSVDVIGFYSFRAAYYHTCSTTSPDLLQ